MCSLINSEIPLLYLSASKHKRLDIEKGLKRHNRSVLFAVPPEFCPEPDMASPLGGILKTIKFLRHMDIIRQLAELEMPSEYWALTMDVNGGIAGRYFSDSPIQDIEAAILTTCRGEVESVVKTAQTARQISERRVHKESPGTVIFDSLCGPVKMRNDDVVDVELFTERWMLDLSPNLLRIMADERTWRKVIEESEGNLELRPVDNARSTGGLDWTVLALYLGLIAKTLNVSGLDIAWKSALGGEIYRANEKGRDDLIVPKMTTQLRGFSENIINGIARLH